MGGGGGAGRLITIQIIMQIVSNAAQWYLLAADDSRCEQGLLGAYNLLPLPQLGSQRLHLLLLLLLLVQQLLALPAGHQHPLLCCSQVEGEKFLAVQEPLHRELSQLQELDQSRVHGVLAPLAPLPIQAAEGHHTDVILKGVHIQLAYHQVYVHSTDAPPVHALPARAELKGEDGGCSTGWSHAWCGCGVAAYRVLAEWGIQEGGDPC